MHLRSRGGINLLRRRRVIKIGCFAFKAKATLVIAFFLCSISVENAFSQKKLLEFGLWADCQYADIEDTSSRTYRAAKDKLSQAIDDFNRLRLPFSISLGDIVDRDFQNFVDLEPILAKADSGIYYVLGNHDFMPTGEQMALKTQIEGVDEPYYYSIIRGKVRIIVLNTNELTSYSTKYDDSASNQAIRYADSLREAGVKVYPMNGSVSETQLVWLEKELKVAQAQGQLVVVMSHHPLLYPFNQVVAQNAKQVRELLEQYSCVKAHLSGHFHYGGYQKRNGIHYLIVPGMVQKNEANYFSKITIFDDRIEVLGNGGEKRTMKFN